MVPILSGTKVENKGWGRGIPLYSPLAILFYFIIFFLILHAWMFCLPVCLYITHVCVVPTEAREFI